MAHKGVYNNIILVSFNLSIKKYLQLARTLLLNPNDGLNLYISHVKHCNKLNLSITFSVNFDFTVDLDC